MWKYSLLEVLCRNRTETQTETQGMKRKKQKPHASLKSVLHSFDNDTVSNGGVRKTSF